MTETTAQLKAWLDRAEARVHEAEARAKVALDAYRTAKSAQAVVFQKTYETELERLCKAEEMRDKLMDRLVDVEYHRIVQQSQTDGLISEMANNIATIKQLVTASSQSSRQASTIEDQDLDAVESALQICFVPVQPGDLDQTSVAALQDTHKFRWDENKPEAKQRREYLAELSSQVNLPNHLTWSIQTDTDILKTSMHAGGAKLPFSISCRTDAMVVASHAPLVRDSAIVATVEMKKKVVRQSLRQTKATYVCASLKSQLPVISCVTDMCTTAVAYYTAGQKRADGVAIVVEHIFHSVDHMLRFLVTALSAQSVPASVMRWRDPTQPEVDIPGELSNPKRVRLPVPAHLRVAEIQPLLASLLDYVGDDGDDVAQMADVDGVFLDPPSYVS